MYYVYVLLSLNYQTRYVGSTDDIDRRLKEHNQGKSRYTKGRKPWKLIYKESYNTKEEALEREKFLKTGKGRELLDELIHNE